MKTAKCPYCDEIVPSDVEECTKCGLEFKAGQAKCNKCGKVVQSDAEECSACGGKFRNIQARPVKGKYKPERIIQRKFVHVPSEPKEYGKVILMAGIIGILLGSFGCTAIFYTDINELRETNDDLEVENNILEMSLAENMTMLENKENYIHYVFNNGTGP
jgi:RNA polymerase subunit RPABC4/transcription elongation factor Spt4